jgi:hypothetical protein
LVAGPAINDLIGGQTPMAVVALTGQVIARLCCKSLKTPGDKFPAGRRISRYHVGADQLQAGGPLQPLRVRDNIYRHGDGLGRHMSNLYGAALTYT